MSFSSLSGDELLRLLKAARAHSERDFLMILTAYSHGLRASEVIALKRDNIRGEMLRVDRLKGSLRTEQPLVGSKNPLLNEKRALLDYTAELHGNDLIFPVSRQTFWRAVQRAASAGKVPPHKAHPHTLKHTCAMQAIEKAKINEVQQYLGHKSLESTGEYLKVSDEQASARIGPVLGNLKS